MLHVEHKAVRELLFRGGFGLEKEGLRVTPEGRMAHTRHPLPGHAHIVRDFCENQTEINTPVLTTAETAVESLYALTREIHRTLAALPEPELLWPFSNPPYIIDEDDIPIARFEGAEAAKTRYREYLSARYGRYKMTLSGIHVNYSFDDALLRADFALSGEPDYTEYKNRLYLDLAESAAAFGWILTAVTAASPLLDSSYAERGRLGGTVFNGMASTRCSELGYWNNFTPLFDYSDIRAYADRMQYYVDLGLIAAPSELYYPVRLKPSGKNDLDRLRAKGVDHIELRMFDLNPLCPEGIDIRDLKFAQLFLIWLATKPSHPLAPSEQIQAAQNFKSAAHYDLDTVKLVTAEGKSLTVSEAGRDVIGMMRGFFRDFGDEVASILDFEEEKFISPEKRYAHILRKQYDGGFVKAGLERAKQYQKA